MTIKVTAGILAGGRGRRMGHIDKGLAELNGQPLIEHVLHRLQPQTPHILISANRNPDRYARYGHPVIADRWPGFQGPLAGIASLLEACGDDWLATTACDTPYLPADYIQRLIAAQQRSGARMVVCHDGSSLQPLHGLFHRELLRDLVGYLEQGGRQARQWIERHHRANADFSDCPDAFVNLNRPEDLRLPQPPGS